MPTDRQRTDREQSENSKTEATLILCGSSGESGPIHYMRHEANPQGSPLATVRIQKMFKSFPHLVWGECYQKFGLLLLILSRHAGKPQIFGGSPSKCNICWNVEKPPIFSSSQMLGIVNRGRVGGKSAQSARHGWVTRPK